MRTRDSQQGFGLEMGFIDHFITQLVNAINHSAVADLHALKITTAHAKSFQSAFTSHFIGPPLLIHLQAISLSG